MSGDHRRRRQGANTQLVSRIQKDFLQYKASSPTPWQAQLQEDQGQPQPRPQQAAWCPGRQQMKREAEAEKQPDLPGSKPFIRRQGIWQQSSAGNAALSSSSCTGCYILGIKSSALVKGQVIHGAVTDHAPLPHSQTFPPPVPASPSLELVLLNPLSIGLVSEAGCGQRNLSACLSC